MVEVVLALGITAFCIVALMGLFSVGLQTEKESKEEFQVAHIAQAILASRRGAPTANLGTTYPFPLPALQQGNSVSKTTVKLNQDGAVATSDNDSRYAMTYRIDAPPAGSRKSFVIHLNFHWPAQASASAAKGHYEILTSMPSP